MPSILIAGSGQIGSAIAQILTQQQTGYSVILADIQARQHTVKLDVQNHEQLAGIVKQNDIKAVVSCLPYFLNKAVAESAKALNLHYFDLTEDVETTTAIAKIAHGAATAFVPQCGVAPGFINIAAHDLMQNFDELDIVKLQCGALPQHTSNALQYALSWSIDGLINEYGNPCPAIIQRESVLLAPLTDLEIVDLDGARYEAFNTSGGAGTLIETYRGKLNSLTYKTLRYPGHCEKIRFLMNDLKLNTDRKTLTKILLNALPYADQDVVIVNICIQGQRDHKYTQENYLRKFYPQTINGKLLTAIQTTTAVSACTVIDLVLQNPQKYHGFVHQADFGLTEFLQNRFGKCLDSPHPPLARQV